MSALEEDGKALKQETRNFEKTTKLLKELNDAGTIIIRIRVCKKVEQIYIIVIVGISASSLRVYA